MPRNVITLPKPNGLRFWCHKVSLSLTGQGFGPSNCSSQETEEVEGVEEEEEEVEEPSKHV